MAKQTIQIADKPTLDEVLAMLNDAETGLASLKSLLGENADAETLAAVKELLQNGTYGLNALKTAINTANSTLGNGTYGLSALKTAINGRANESTVTSIKSLLENTTYGLNALKTTVNNLKGTTTYHTCTFTVTHTAAGYMYSPTITLNGSGEILIIAVNSGGAKTTLFNTVLNGESLGTLNAYDCPLKFSGTISFKFGGYYSTTGTKTYEVTYRVTLY